ncbi:LacI family DNA-binding transcriptional regulator [Streptomyces sp. NPDC007861]|uniref:LacI family DNA-binding transcriptional regulator n=1 Tax=Streptomyces sp. NPDC007861 TaxID=3154893 RepID=UPI0033C0DB47
MAARAGVSVATVSRVVRGKYHVSPTTAAKVRKAVAELDYVANAQARALAGSSSGMVAVLTSDVTSAFYNHITRGISRQVAVENRLCLVGTTEGDLDREMAMLGLLRGQDTSAVVLIGGVSDSAEYRERIGVLARSLDAAGSRLVLCGRPSPGGDAPVTVVEYDSEGGAFAITSHLLSKGHERILFFGGLAGTTTTVPRVTGYQRALEAYGIEPDPALVIHGDRSSRRGAYEQMTRLVTDRAVDFSAVFACDDLVALGVLRALRDQGVSVPDDISVVGYDDIPAAMDAVPPLTTVHVPLEQIGRTAVELALSRSDVDARGGQHVVLGTHIVVRDTVAPRIRK